MPWSRVCVEKLIIDQLFKKFPKHPHMLLLKLHFNIILPSVPKSPSGLGPSGFLIKATCALLDPSLLPPYTYYMPCPHHPLI
jgi:hypothetical protein